MLLGLHPGLGGTVRLPRLINPTQAMTMMLTGRSERARRARAPRSGRRGHAGAPCARRRAGRRQRRPEKGQTGLCRLAPEPQAGAPNAGIAHGERSRQAGAARALSGALRADRSVGRARRQCRSRAKGGDFFLCQTLSRRHRAKSGARVLPARQAEKPRRRQVGRQARSRHRRRHHGRRHRGVVRLERLYRHARRYQREGNRRRRQARRRALRQDRPRRSPPRARCARPPHSRSER